MLLNRNLNDSRVERAAGGVGTGMGKGRLTPFPGCIMAVAVPLADHIAILIEMAIVLVRMQTARFNLAPSHNARQHTIARTHRILCTRAS